MTFKALPLIVLALSLVRAAPSVADTDASLSEKFAVPCAIVNVGMNGTIFTFDKTADDSDLEVFLPVIWETSNKIWNRWNDPKSDRWLFENRETGQFLTVDQTNDYIITSDNLEATMFSVTHAGEGHLMIKLPYEDKVFEAIYDGSSMEYAHIELRPANGGINQRWMYTSGLD
ncbi:hypothetical protein FB45DRAFT_1105980 [Roridomyces roridus]|uniref:Ricin B lectin domain-containing protein n=1 Tax=Roridomyces roridus TaxID=1738132 RepID=A0AAD7BCJ2_9AGAR|nr:hypothetical protein FB45DRAFT_1105980 [Roridomyces roridus]